MVKLLIDNFKDQIDINIKDNYGYSALYAGKSNNTKMVNLLIEILKIR